MKVELHINGSHQVILIPETKVEKAVLEQMGEAAEKGRAVRLTGSTVPDALAFVVSVEA